MLWKKVTFFNAVSCRQGARYLSSAANIPEMPKCDFKPQPYTGKNYEETLKIRSQNLNPSLKAYYKSPVLIHQGHMQWLWDQNQKRYLDLFAGIVTVSVGHCHPKVTQAGIDQMKKLWHTTHIYMYPAIHEYAKKLTDKLPGNLKNVYFVNSGSEANDLAVLMARLHTGVYEMISLRNCYHGASSSMMGVTAHSPWRYNTPTGFGVHHAVNPDVYKGPWGGANCRDSPIQTQRSCDCAPGTCQAGDNYVDQIEDLLRHSTPKDKVGGFILEAVQGVGGTVQFPKNFAKRAFESVRKRGGVCISDEVQTGFGRMGSHFWGFETHGIIPDIVTMAKGIGNGIPLAAVVTTPEIAATMGRALHFNTYGGNPISSAIGSAVLDAIEEDNCQKTCEVVGTYFLTELAKLRDEFEVVGDVRGKGLMIGIELVHDKESKKALAQESVLEIFEAAKDHGVLLGKGGLNGNVIRIKPPMCITIEDVNFSIAVLREVLRQFTATRKV